MLTNDSAHPGASFLPQVSGIINNTGHSVVLTLGGTSHHHPPINITGGPLSYRYQVSVRSNEAIDS